MAARMATSCFFAVVVSKPWTTGVKLSTNLKANLYASLQLFRKDLRVLKDKNDFSEQHSIFLENKPLVTGFIHISDVLFSSVFLLLGLFN